MSAMRTIMRDSAHQRTMEEDGYIVIEDFLSPEEVNHLLEVYKSLPSDLVEILALPFSPPAMLAFPE